MSRLSHTKRVAGALVNGFYRFLNTAQNLASFTHANSAARTYTLPDADTTFIGASETVELTNKTITAAVFSGTATGTYTLGGTPTIASPIITGVAGATPTVDVLYTDSIVKAWLKCDVTGGIQDDVNVASIDDDNPGDLGINWATAFGDGDYAVVAMALATTGVQLYCTADVQSSGLTDLECFSEDGTQSDPLNWMVIAIGRQ